MNLSFLDKLRVKFKRPRCTCKSHSDPKTGRHYLNCAAFAPQPQDKNKWWAPR